MQVPERARSGFKRHDRDAVLAPFVGLGDRILTNGPDEPFVGALRGGRVARVADGVAGYRFSRRFGREGCAGEAEACGKGRVQDCGVNGAVEAVAIRSVYSVLPSLSSRGAAEPPLFVSSLSPC